MLIYDPEADQWNSMGQLATARSLHAMSIVTLTVTMTMTFRNCIKGDFSSTVALIRKYRVFF